MTPLTIDQQVHLLNSYEKMYRLMANMRKYQIQANLYRASSDRAKQLYYERLADNMITEIEKERKKRQIQVL